MRIGNVFTLSVLRKMECISSPINIEAIPIIFLWHYCILYCDISDLEFHLILAMQLKMEINE
jgi:hypothetical protein